MKYAELKIISQKLSNFHKIFAIERVNDTTLKIVFDKVESYYFNLARGDSYIYKSENQKRVKSYNAPFDVVLKKRFTNASIDRVEVLCGDKILRFYTTSSSNYKAQKTILQLEFTGRHTNIVILDSDLVVLEALRHIDISKSFREVRVGVKLLDLKTKDFKDESAFIDDLDRFLIEEHSRREKKKLANLKTQKTSSLRKKLKRLKAKLNNLPKQSDLLLRANELEFKAGLLLANLHQIKNYQDRVVLKDYNENSIEIELPKESKTPANGANILFNRSKKLKQKAKRLYKERENLEQKIDFLERLINAIESAKSSDEVELYLPKQPKKQKKRDLQDSNIENFYFKEYKILLGKNKKGNIALLKEAKMSDIWLHLKDIPSTHVIIRTNKTKIDDEVLEFAAKLCVDFSVKERGRYIVDYTPRRNVKVRDGANVNYVDFKSITIIKD